MENFLRKITFSSLIVASLHSIPHIAANPKNELPLVETATEETSAPRVEKINEEIFQAVIGQLNKLDALLQDIALLVNNEAFAIPQKDTVRKNITALRMPIDNARKNLVRNADIQSCAQAIRLANALLNYIQNALKNNLRDMPEFEMIPTRSGEEIDIEGLDRLLQNNNAKLKSLANQSQTLGLSWYNKVYRSFNTTIIRPMEKYNVLQIAGAGLGLLALGGAFKYLISEQKEQISLPVLGTIDGTSAKMILERTLEHNVTIPAAGWLISQAFEPVKNMTQKAYNKTRQKIHQAHAFLQGGSVYKSDEAFSLSDIKVDFSHMIGQQQIKNILSVYPNFFKNPEAFQLRGLLPARGVILTGPPRSGKTHAAKCLAGEIQQMLKKEGKGKELKFFEIRAAEIMQAGGISTWMAAAKHHAPCIIFIDEIDMLRLTRTNGDTNLLSDFLTAIGSTIEPDINKLVIIMAATTHPENLDDALRSAGRLSLEIRFEHPPYADRLELRQRKLKNLSMDIALFNLEKIARETEGSSFEALNEMVDRAFQKAMITNSIVTQKDLEISVDEEIRKIIPVDEKDLHEEEQILIAAHQAGQALARIILNPSKKFAKVTVNKMMPKIKEEALMDKWEGKEKPETIQYGGIFTYCENDTLQFNTRADKLKECQILLAGFAAEKMVLGSCGYSYRSRDKIAALEIAKSLAMEGLQPGDLSKNELSNRLDKALQIVTECENKVTALIEQHKELLISITGILGVVKSLDAQQIELIAALAKMEKSPEGLPAELLALLGLPAQEPANSEVRESEISAQIHDELGIDEVRAAA